MQLAKEADSNDIPDGMDIPVELARRQDRLAAITECFSNIAHHYFLYLSSPS